MLSRSVPEEVQRLVSDLVIRVSFTGATHAWKALPSSELPFAGASKTAQFRTREGLEAYQHNVWMQEFKKHRKIEMKRRAMRERKSIAQGSRRIPESTMTSVAKLVDEKQQKLLSLVSDAFPGNDTNSRVERAAVRRAIRSEYRRRQKISACADLPIIQFQRSDPLTVTSEESSANQPFAESSRFSHTKSYGAKPEASCDSESSSGSQGSSCEQTPLSSPRLQPSATAIPIRKDAKRKRALKFEEHIQKVEAVRREKLLCKLLEEEAHDIRNNSTTNVTAANAIPLINDDACIMGRVVWKRVEQPAGILDWPHSQNSQRHRSRLLLKQKSHAKYSHNPNKKLWAIESASKRTHIKSKKCTTHREIYLQELQSMRLHGSTHLYSLEKDNSREYNIEKHGQDMNMGEKASECQNSPLQRASVFNAKTMASCIGPDSYSSDLAKVAVHYKTRKGSPGAYRHQVKRRVQQQISKTANTSHTPLFLSPLVGTLTLFPKADQGSEDLLKNQKCKPSYTCKKTKPRKSRVSPFGVGLEGPAGLTSLDKSLPISKSKEASLDFSFQVPNLRKKQRSSKCKKSSKTNFVNKRRSMKTKSRQITKSTSNTSRNNTGSVSKVQKWNSETDMLLKRVTELQLNQLTKH